MSNHNDILTVTTIDPDGTLEQPASPLQLSPLTISALMVTKTDLIAALRVYLPNIADIEAIDADRFLLSVSGEADQNGSDS